MASCTLNTKSRQRVHRHNYYLSAVCPDRWHNWWYIVSWCDHLTFESAVASGQWWGDVTWWWCVGWCDVLKEDTRPRSPVLPIIAQFNWQLAGCSELLNFRSNSAGLGSHWHSLRYLYLWLPSPDLSSQAQNARPGSCQYKNNSNTICNPPFINHCLRIRYNKECLIQILELFRMVKLCCVHI